MKKKKKHKNLIIDNTLSLSHFATELSFLKEPPWPMLKSGPKKKELECLQVQMGKTYAIALCKIVSVSYLLKKVATRGESS